MQGKCLSDRPNVDLAGKPMKKTLRILPAFMTSQVGRKRHTIHSPSLLQPCASPLCRLWSASSWSFAELYLRVLSADALSTGNTRLGTRASIDIVKEKRLSLPAVASYHQVIRAYAQWCHLDLIVLVLLARALSITTG